MFVWLVRDASWLSLGRVRAWCLILASVMGLWGGVMLLAQISGAAWGGLGGDFPCFYAAGLLARHGSPALAYAPGALAAAEHALQTGQQGGYLPFFYPPPFLMVCWLLAALPYWVAFTVFLAAGLVPLALAARRLLPAGAGWLPFLAYPGLWITVLAGQNGLILAACLAWFMLLADRRALAGGACLGVLMCKPHLAVGVPFALAAAGRWRSLVGVGLCALALCLASFLILGMAPWVAFWHAAHAAGAAITGGMIQEVRIQSVFMAARLLGAGLVTASVLQGLTALVVLVVLIRFARTRPSGEALGAAMAASALLMTPYCMDYDLVCLAPCLAFLARRTDDAGGGPYLRFVLFVAFLLPLLSSVMAANAHVQGAPVVMGMVLMFVAGGVRQEERPSFLKKRSKRLL
jgi:hypothetical protein